MGITCKADVADVERVETCRFWKAGVCLELTRIHAQVVACPLARAAGSVEKGVCCHDPMHEIRTQIQTMQRAQFDYRAFQPSGPGWVARAWAKFATTQTSPCHGQIWTEKYGSFQISTPDQS